MTYTEWSIASRYAEACRTPSDIWEHLPILHNLARELDAQNIIELGTRGGVSTLAWLAAVERTGGHVYSVDIDPGPQLEHRQWTFIQGDDLSPEVIAQLPDSADIVFIDTSHDYRDTLAELNVYRYRVRPGGRIVLHDTNLKHPLDVPRFPEYPVRVAVDEFCAEEDLNVTYLPNCFGLGIVEMT